MATQATSAISDFFNTYKKPILIGLGVLIVLVLLYTFFSGGRSEGFHQGPYMPHQRQEGFYSEPNEEGPMDGMQKKLVLFYAPWCPHCKSLMDGEGSTWQNLLRKYAGRKDLMIDQVNCDEKPDVATQYGIGGFPTIMLFSGGKTFTYNGDRSLESIEKFLESPSA